MIDFSSILSGMKNATNFAGRALAQSGRQAIGAIGQELSGQGDLGSTSTTSGMDINKPMSPPETNQPGIRDTALGSPQQADVKAPIFDKAAQPATKINGENVTKELEKIHAGIITYLNVINKNNLAAFEFVQAKFKQQDASIVKIEQKNLKIEKSIKGIDERLIKLQREFKNLESQGGKKGSDIIPFPTAGTQSQTAAGLGVGAGAGLLGAGLLGASALIGASVGAVGGATGALLLRSLIPAVARMLPPLIAAYVGHEGGKVIKDILKRSGEADVDAAEPHTRRRWKKGSGRDLPLPDPQQLNRDIEQNKQDEDLSRTRKSKGGFMEKFGIITPAWGAEGEEPGLGTGRRGSIAPSIPPLTQKGGGSWWSSQANKSRPTPKGYTPSVGGTGVADLLTSALGDFGKQLSEILRPPSASGDSKTYGPPDVSKNQFISPTDLIESMSAITGGKGFGGMGTPTGGSGFGGDGSYGGVGPGMASGAGRSRSGGRTGLSYTRGTGTTFRRGVRAGSYTSSGGTPADEEAFISRSSAISVEGRSILDVIAAHEAEGSTRAQEYLTGVAGYHMKESYGKAPAGKTYLGMDIGGIEMHPHIGDPSWGGFFNRRVGQPSFASGRYQEITKTYYENVLRSRRLHPGVNVEGWTQEAQDIRNWDKMQLEYAQKYKGLGISGLTGNLERDLQSNKENSQVIGRMMTTGGGEWTSMPGGPENPQSQAGAASIYQRRLGMYKEPRQTHLVTSASGSSGGEENAVNQSDLAYLQSRGAHSMIGGEKGDPGAFRMPNPELIARLSAAGRAYEKQTGQRAKFGEMDRDDLTQAKYYNEMMAAGGPRAGNIAARPISLGGRGSEHYYGRATDLPDSDFRTWMRSGESTRFGLDFPVRGDAPHTQMMRGYEGPNFYHPEPAKGSDTAKVASDTRNNIIPFAGVGGGTDITAGRTFSGSGSQKGTVYFVTGIASRGGASEKVIADARHGAEASGKNFVLVPHSPTSSADDKDVLAYLRSQKITSKDTVMGHSAGGYIVSKNDFNGAKKVVVGAPGAAGNQTFSGGHNEQVGGWASSVSGDAGKVSTTPVKQSDAVKPGGAAVPEAKTEMSAGGLKALTSIQEFYEKNKGKTILQMAKEQHPNVPEFLIRAGIQQRGINPDQTINKAFLSKGGGNFDDLKQSGMVPPGVSKTDFDAAIKTFGRMPDKSSALMGGFGFGGKPGSGSFQQAGWIGDAREWMSDKLKGKSLAEPAQEPSAEGDSIWSKVERWRRGAADLLTKGGKLSPPPDEKHAPSSGVSGMTRQSWEAEETFPPGPRPPDGHTLSRPNFGKGRKGLSGMGFEDDSVQKPFFTSFGPTFGKGRGRSKRDLVPGEGYPVESIERGQLSALQTGYHDDMTSGAPATKGVLSDELPPLNPSVTKASPYKSVGAGKYLADYHKGFETGKYRLARSGFRGGRQHMAQDDPQGDHVDLPEIEVKPPGPDVTVVEPGGHISGKAYETTPGSYGQEVPRARAPKAVPGPSFKEITKASGQTTADASVPPHAKPHAAVVPAATTGVSAPFKGAQAAVVHDTPTSDWLQSLSKSPPASTDNEKTADAMRAASASRTKDVIPSSAKERGAGTNLAGVAAMKKIGKGDVHTDWEGRNAPVPHMGTTKTGSPHKESMPGGTTTPGVTRPFNNPESSPATPGFAGSGPQSNPDNIGLCSV